MMYWLIALQLPHGLAAINRSIAEAFNSVAGRSWLVDTLIYLPIANELIKAAVIGSCFMAAWHGTGTRVPVDMARKTLIITLITAACVLATTKAISHSVLFPRPFVQSLTVYHFHANEVVETERLTYRLPLDGTSQGVYRELLDGRLPANDLGSFPSDHAGLFVTLALGILLVSRAAGAIALIWTIVVILASRLITGLHWPLDIAVGSAIGCIELAFLLWLGNTRLGRMLDGVSRWTLNHRALSTAVLFAILYEISSTFTHLAPLLAGVAKHTPGIGG